MIPAMSAVTPREIILANISWSGAPRHGLTFDRGRLCDMHFVWCAASSGYKPRRWLEGQFEYYDDEWGNIWRRMVGGCAKGEIFEAAIKDWAQLAKYQGPHYEEELLAAHFRQGFTAAGNLFKVAGIGGWIFDNARYLRKMEVYFEDMALYPEELHRLHALVAKVYRIKIRAAGQAGADAIMIGEDMGTQTGLLFSPSMWQEYFGAMYKELFALAHDFGMKVLMHSCGNNREIVPHLLAAGVDCFQFDQPAIYDMPWLARQLREHQAALWAPVDIQKILPTGDRQRIAAGVREMCRIFRGGLIAKNYPDLPGIGVKEEWDQWAYEEFLRDCGLTNTDPNCAVPA